MAEEATSPGPDIEAGLGPEETVAAPPQAQANSSDYRVVHINDSISNATNHFCSNVVITAKYSLINFLPKFLFESFQKVANVYFLVVIIFQSIPAISNTGGNPTLLPVLVFILAIDALFAILEDVRRHRADRAANSRKCHVYEGASGQFVVKKWRDIVVGDVIMVINREIIPADLMLLAVKEPDEEVPSGICYVETKSLDGETNLKMRQAIESTMMRVKKPADVRSLRGKVLCEQPNRAIDKFTGTWQLYGQPVEPIPVKSILLRGCVLRNTDYVYGLVLNTGLDTKITRNSSETPSKKSSSDRFVNSQILMIVILLFCNCVIAATGNLIWERSYATSWYFRWTPDELTEYFLMALRFFLLNYQFIPVSLYVTMAGVKYCQAFFIAEDREMYHEETDTPALVRNMTLNEDLGQVAYVFSDKTGTLTCNVMSYRKCSINGVSYGKGTTEIGRAALKRKGVDVPENPPPPENPRGKGGKSIYVNFLGEDELFDAMKDDAADAQQREKIHQFFTHLAVCHTVIPEKVEDKDEIVYSASSPDEQALVAGAKYMGFEFLDRSPGTIKYALPSGAVRTLEILDVLEFNSTRKRMSIVTLDPETNKLLLYTKGADAVIVPRLVSANDPVVEDTLQHMEDYAEDGLRTLAIAVKDLQPEEYEEWSDRFHEAMSSIPEIEKRQRGEDNAIDRCMDELEQGLTLVGATAIEDRLQDGVPQTIAQLRKAGIKVWMLTGDKQETAVNIAFACQLFNDDMRRVYLTMEQNQSTQAIISKLEEENKELSKNDAAKGEPLALVVDSEALETLLNVQYRREFYEFSQHCSAVVACRVSPAQKAQLVYLVRNNARGCTTLAIGDGANDVGMIQKAQVGIGISGMEGMQAVMASDYAIAQFRFLGRLLLVHGRWNYLRMSRLVPYMFYKCILLEMTQYWYSWFQGFSGQKFFLEVGLQAYNVLYTAIPIFLHGVLDKDVSADFAMRHPQLYKAGIHKRFLNKKKFWMWLVSGLYHSLLINVVTMLAFENAATFGSSVTLWVYGAVAYTAIVHVSNFKLALCQLAWNWYNILGLVVSIGSWYLSAIFFSNSYQLGGYAWMEMFQWLLASPNYWAAMIMIIFFTVAVDFGRRAWKLMTRPHFNDVAREVEILQQAEADLDLIDNGAVAAPTALAAGSGLTFHDSIAVVVDKQTADSLDATGGQGRKTPFSPATEKKKKKDKKAKAVVQTVIMGSKLRRTGFAFSNDQDTTEAESFMVSNRFSVKRLRKIFTTQAQRQAEHEDEQKRRQAASQILSVMDDLKSADVATL